LWTNAFFFLVSFTGLLYAVEQERVEAASLFGIYFLGSVFVLPFIVLGFSFFLHLNWPRSEKSALGIALKNVALEFEEALRVHRLLQAERRENEFKNARATEQELLQDTKNVRD
jgi:hypothetical protein